MAINFSPKPALILAAMGLVILSGCGKAQSSSSAVSQAASSQSSQQSTSSQPVSAASQAESSSVSSSSPTISTVSLASSQPIIVPVKTPAAFVPESTKADSSYLDDAVFIGDSVSLKLKNYVTAKRKTNAAFFGKAQFLAAGSMGSGNALKPLGASSIHPLYNGKKALLEDSVAAMGVKKVYIMLGINDIAPYGTDGAVRNMGTLIERIKAKSPDVKIFVQSSTPIIKTKQLKTLNNPNLVDYDYKLSVLCEDKGYYFVDVAAAMRDQEGNLPLDYCSDPDNLGIHFTDKACEVWIDYLLKHTVS